MIDSGNIKLKVCGMRDRNNIQDVARHAPDFLGFIFYPLSPRFVGQKLVLPESIGSIRKVGVFVNQPVDEILEVVSRYRLDYVQLHGEESAVECEALREHVKVIKVFHVADDFDFKVTRDYAAVADYFLFDTKGKFYGGNSIPFNWEVLKKYDQQVPFFLSGGVSPENIGDVLSMKGLNLYAVDVNSGVEVTPGFKDPSKVAVVKKLLKQKISV